MYLFLRLFKPQQCILCSDVTEVPYYITKSYTKISPTSLAAVKKFTAFRNCHFMRFFDVKYLFRRARNQTKFPLFSHKNLLETVLMNEILHFCKAI